jgi:hypothetical protein
MSEEEENGEQDYIDWTLQRCNREHHLVKVCRIVDAHNPGRINWAGMRDRDKTNERGKQSLTDARAHMREQHGREREQDVAGPESGA